MSDEVQSNGVRGSGEILMVGVGDGALCPVGEFSVLTVALYTFYKSTFKRRTLFKKRVPLSPRVRTSGAIAFHYVTPRTRGMRVANSFLPAGGISAPVNGCSVPKMTSLGGSRGNI